MPSNLTITNVASRLLPSATATPARSGVTIKAGPGNGSDVVYVGFSSAVTAGTNAATDGYPLAASQEWNIPPSIIPGRDASNIYVISSANTLKAFYVIPSV